MSKTDRIRKEIIEAISYETSNHGEPPDEGRLYIPRAHVKALKLESSLIVGSRGVGKSFWTAVLGNPNLLRVLKSSVNDLERTRVRVGFSVRENTDSYPNRDIFTNLLQTPYTPYEIWKAVVLRWLSDLVGEKMPTNDWQDSVDWVRSNPEPIAKITQKANGMLQGRDEKALLVFDALDRSSDDWQVMDKIVRDLLQVALWLKSYPAIHAKVFLREDQLERTVTNFADASKLMATRAVLDWQTHDLHGLLWHLLCNSPESRGESSREIYEEIVGRPPEDHEGYWSLTEKAKHDESVQRALFEKLAGSWMGRDRRRGVPYIWSISHLADGKRRTSPRSFLAAIRAAAEDSLERYPEHSYPLHYESIKRGVQKASEIRIAEIAEDYPWVKTLFGPLKGMSVPCEQSAIAERWSLELDDKWATLTKDRLPPQNMERGWPGIIDELDRLGIIEKMKDKRINMPDLYRVGFGLGRRGGVKTIRPHSS